MNRKDENKGTEFLAVPAAVMYVFPSFPQLNPAPYPTAPRVPTLFSTLFFFSLALLNCCTGKALARLEAIDS
jgi:hypothetical protein